MMPVSLEQFVEQLNECGLFDPGELSSVRAQSTAETVEQFARELVKQKKLTPFQAQQVYNGRGKSLILGNYVLLEKIGQGGMGLVFKAQHRRMKRTVALKVLSPSVSRNASLIARFQREVQAVARLEHPNIVSAFDADEAAGTSFLVMQYVDGQDLSTLVKTKGPLPLEQAVNCILQAAQGLDYAHRQGVVHRDIKPANLLLDSEGSVKILDMGLARMEGGNTGNQAELTNTGAVMGTVDYMAPEQALSTKSADARSDIYALGISLWYVLVGKPPYEGDSLMARMLAHREAPIPSLIGALSANSGNPSRLLEATDAVFRKMVAKRPADRYQTMGEVCAALEACLRGEAPVARITATASSGDQNFHQFLAGLANSDPAIAVASRSAAVSIPAFAEFEPTQASSSPSAQTDPQTLVRPKPTKKRSREPAPALVQKWAWWTDRRVQIGGPAAVLVCAAIGLLFWPRAPQVKPPSETITTGLSKPPTARSGDQPINAPGDGVPVFFGDPAAQGGNPDDTPNETTPSPARTSPTATPAVR